ncbi:MAG: ATP-binding protein [Candidatus Dormibacteria bacterium]
MVVSSVTSAREVDLERSIGRALLRMIELGRQDAEVSDDVERSAQLLAEEGCRLLPDLQCRISIIPPGRPDTARMLAVAGAGATDLRGTEWPIALTPTRWTMEGRGAAERLVGPDAPAALLEMMPGPRTTVRAVPLQGSGPLADERATLGAFVVLRPGDRPFTDGERRIIDAYAGLVSVALVRAELRQETIEQARRLEIGVEVAVDLALSPEPTDVVRRLLERATDALDADRAALVRVDGGMAITEGAHDVDGRPALQGVEAPVERHPMALEALQTRRPVLGGAAGTRDVPGELREAHLDVKHTALLPLLFAGEMVGFLSVYRRRDPPFHEGDVKTLQIIGNVAVLALRNARLYADAQAAAEGMSSFVDLVVHELRSPLTVIAGYIDMMQRRSPDGQDRWDKPLETVATKIAEMQALVNELILSARLASGTMAPPSTVVDIRDRVESALRRAEARSRMVEAELLADLPPEPVMVTCEPSNVDHILDNLINNALSYGGFRPRICVSVDPPPLGPRVMVSDDGPGISADLHERIFERFFRVNPLPGQPGSGLGLHISRQLAAQSRGSLEVDHSEPGKGSRFVLRLPAAGARASAS